VRTTKERPEQPFRVLCLVTLLGSISFIAHAEVFIAPTTGTLYLSCIGGSAGAVSQFGTGTSIGTFIPYLSSLPQSCPTNEVSIGTVTAGQSVPFGIHTVWQGQDYYAFSTGTDQASVIAFSDTHNSLGMGGKIIQQTGTNTWVMHLDDAASYLVDDNDSDILIQVRLVPSSGGAPPVTPPQTGIGTCSTATVTGTYFYLLGGDIVSSGRTMRYAELGKLVADGRGAVSGQSYASVGGQQSTYVLNGTYTVQSNCAGSITLSTGQSTNTLTFQIVSNAQEMIVAVSSSSAVAVGAAYRQTSSATPTRCGVGSLTGAFGYVLAGLAPAFGGVLYSDAGQFVADGNGNETVASVGNFGGAVTQSTATGTYTIAADCAGTAKVTNANGTINYRLAIVRDGAEALLFGTDPGWVISGIFTPELTNGEKISSGFPGRR